MTIGESDAGGFIAFAEQLADAAAQETLRHFRQLIAIEDKAGGGRMDPVTEADRGAETAIRQMITKHFPSHGIVGEEFENKPADSAYEWVLDPIDGTRSFVTGVPLWGTLICLQKDGVPLIGLIDQPYIGERFIGGATKSGGAGKAWLNAKGATMTLATSGCEELCKASLGTTTSEVFVTNAEKDAFSLASKDVRMLRFGGDCYLYAMLAAGHLDLVIEASLKPFDVAALVPIVESAGGVITQWSGEPAHLGGRIVAAATPALHEAALAKLAEGYGG